MLREADVRAFAAAHRDGGIEVDVREPHGEFTRAETAGLAPASGPADGRAA
jgi:hypothetical protein